MHTISVKEAYLNFWKKAFSFDGRVSRREYWIPVIINLIIALMLIALMMFIDQQLGYGPEAKHTPGDRVLDFAKMVYTIPNLTLLVRRLHDLDIPGVFAAFPLVLSFIGMVIILLMGALKISNSTVIIIIISILALVQIVIFFICTLKKGTTGPNDYGEDPLAE